MNHKISTSQLESHYVTVGELENLLTNITDKDIPVCIVASSGKAYPVRCVVRDEADYENKNGKQEIIHLKI